MSELSENIPSPAEPAANGNRFLQAHLILMYFLGAVVLVWLLSGIYQVRINQVAIVERLGEFVTNTDNQVIEYKAGLHYHLPWPIDDVHLVSNTELLTLKAAAFNTKPAAYAEMKQQLRHEGYTDDAMLDAVFDPYLITADKSIVNMEIEATYRVDNAYLWLMTVSHESDVAGEPNDMRARLFQVLAQRAMIHEISHLSLEDVLFEKRAQLPQDMLTTIRHDFAIWDPADTTGKKSLNLGIEIQKVDISILRPPVVVGQAYDSVANARQMSEAITQSAKNEASKRMIQAEATANTTRLQADGYATGRIADATAEKNRFKEVLERFHAAPEITRFKLLEETVTLLSRSAKQVFIATPGQQTTITIPPRSFDTGQAQ